MNYLCTKKVIDPDPDGNQAGQTPEGVHPVLGLTGQLISLLTLFSYFGLAGG